MNEVWKYCTERKKIIVTTTIIIILIIIIGKDYNVMSNITKIISIFKEDNKVQNIGH